MNNTADSPQAPGWRTQLVLVIVTIAIYAPAVASVGLLTDVGAHIRFAEKVSLTGLPFGSPYLFEQITIIVRAVFPFGELSTLFPALRGRQTIWDVAGVLTVVAFVAAAAVLVLRRLTAAGPSWPWKRPGLVAVTATVAVMVAGPVTMLTWSDHRLLLGYVSVPAYENASLNLLKPFALLLFWGVLDRIGERRSDARTVALIALVSVMAVHAKPSFTICFLPIVALLAIGRQTTGRTTNWRLLIWGLAVPSVVYSLTQYVSFAEGASLRIAPLEVVRGLLAGDGRAVWWVFPFLALSVAYPAAATIAYWPRARRSLSLATAWAVTGLGVAIFLLFQITGRTDYGDLVGSAQIGVFLLLVEATIITASAIADRQAVGDGSGRLGLRLAGQDRVVMACLSLQVLCGAMLWYREIVSPAEWW